MTTHRRPLVWFFILPLAALGAMAWLEGQTARTHITTGTSLPANCSVGDIWIKTGGSDGLYSCLATDTWTASGGGGNVTATGTVGSEPGSPSSGDLYLPSDGFYAERYSGSAWALWGPIFPMTAPVSGDFSWVNQESATVSTTHGGIYLSAPSASGDHLNLRVKTAPATPYTITIAFLTQLSNTNFHAAGFCWRQSSDGKAVEIAANNGNSMGVAKWNSATSYSAAYTATGSQQWTGLIFFRATDNGTNRVSSFSKDGQNWIQLHSVSRTDFMTADQVGFCVNANNATSTNTANMTLLSWKES